MTSPLARPAPLDLDVQRSEERTLVTVSGELDAATASYLYDRLAELEVEGVTNVVLDLARLNFMDSTGLGVIVTEHKRVQRGGGSLTIFCALVTRAPALRNNRPHASSRHRAREGRAVAGEMTP